ncbi:MAG: hypothetical protein M3123_04975 [Actinomycetota bacterium]|nr:hypothetical protein [Actinomycetota bacterium]
MRRTLLTSGIGAVLLAGSIAALGVIVKVGSPSSDSLAASAAAVRLEPASGNFALGDARAFDDFPLYYAGASLAGQPLTAILRRDDRPHPGETIQPNTVAFVYGDCVPDVDGGCAPPLEVKMWPACRRNPAVYDLPPEEELTVRGVPGYFYENGTRLELSTGRVTVVLYGSERSDLLEAAASLEPVNASASAGHGDVASPVGAATAGAAEGELLPPPAPGALEGALACRNGE